MERKWDGVGKNQRARDCKSTGQIEVKFAEQLKNELS
jgi:hypothetical protein